MDLGTNNDASDIIVVSLTRGILSRLQARRVWTRRAEIASRV